LAFGRSELSGGASPFSKDQPHPLSGIK